MPAKREPKKPVKFPVLRGNVEPNYDLRDVPDSEILAEAIRRGYRSLGKPTGDQDLRLAAEWGYRACEQGNNLQAMLGKLNEHLGKPEPTQASRKAKR